MVGGGDAGWTGEAERIGKQPGPNDVACNMWRERAGGEEKRGMLGEAGMLPGTEETRSRSGGGGEGGPVHQRNGRRQQSSRRGQSWYFCQIICIKTRRKIMFVPLPVPFVFQRSAADLAAWRLKSPQALRSNSGKTFSLFFSPATHPPYRSDSAMQTRPASLGADALAEGRADDSRQAGNIHANLSILRRSIPGPVEEGRGGENQFNLISEMPASPSTPHTQSQ
ncbi:hypothetical protein JOQ06_025136, partial [Pogonophryne albipinna]